MNAVQAWNRRHPNGTPVVWRRLDGVELLTETASAAFWCPMSDAAAVLVAAVGRGPPAAVRLDRLTPCPGGAWSPERTGEPPERGRERRCHRRRTSSGTSATPAATSN